MQITLLTEEQIKKLEAEMPITKLAFNGLTQLEREKAWTVLINQFELKKKGICSPSDDAVEYHNSKLAKQAKALEHFTNEELEEIKQAVKEHVPIKSIANRVGKKWHLVQKVSSLFRAPAKSTKGPSGVDYYHKKKYLKERESLNYFTSAEIEQIKKAQREHIPITAVAQFMGKDYEITRQAANALKRKCKA